MELRSLLLIVVTAFTTSDLDCITGWFGSNCLLKCRCRRPGCDSLDGNCRNHGGCALANFGTACQFYNMVRMYSLSMSPTYLQDGNDNTCNPNRSSTMTIVTLSEPMRFQWFQLRVRNARKNFTLIVTLGSIGSLCRNMQKYVFDNTTVDVICSTDVTADMVIITGDLSAELCSLHFSGGRNVALKQRTAMDTSATVDNGGAGAAVDGNTDDDASHLSCATTKPAENGGIWQMSLSATYHLLSIFIYNRNMYAYRLIGFVVLLFDEKEELMYTYKDPATASPRPIYTIPLPRIEGVKTVGITKHAVVPSLPERVLTLCEVETYSDGICPNGTYGFYCERSCSFCPGLFCSPFTGQCAQACAPPRKGLRCEDCPDGTYGVLCDRKCSDTCLNGLCHHFTGNCLNCQGNVTGSRCEACTLGHYGDSCTENCSTQCVKLECEKSFGHCMACNSPRTGEFCEECPERTFGIDCTEICIPKCNIGYCHHLTGDCLKCLGNFTGSQCKECIATAHGPNCTLSCPEFCLEQTCDDFTADCPLCQGVRSGPKCEECPQGTYGGADCSENCSQFCLGGQCRTDGSCLECKSRRLGAQCDMCPPGTYGPECLSQCPPFCAKSVCQSLSGNCFRCKSGRIGSTCEECPPNQYGPNCSLTCSFTCFNAECDKNSGECSRCIEGFKGPMCSEAEKEKGGAWLLLLLLPIPIVALSLFCISRRNNTSSEEEGLPEQNIKLSRVASDLRHE